MNKVSIVLLTAIAAIMSVPASAAELKKSGETVSAQASFEIVNPTSLTAKWIPASTLTKGKIVRDKTVVGTFSVQGTSAGKIAIWGEKGANNSNFITFTNTKTQTNINTIANPRNAAINGYGGSNGLLNRVDGKRAYTVSIKEGGAYNMKLVYWDGTPHEGTYTTTINASYVSE
ncbi:hypothetical protein [Escherichia coli]|uniref:hypothetical protein n=1 Tax=Escherichia coli TaxID=562 RepID=UPI000C7E7488|nr:hypothetical protein [Escherichia coli]AUM10820.1 hypothetical protein CFI09_26490 [Escherichia coli]MBZ8327426.1 hypothetical protein [Escherichia coli]